MTDSAGTPAEPGPGPDASEEPGTDGTDSSPAPDTADRAEKRPRRNWMRWTALGVAVFTLGAAGAAWTAYRKLDSNITSDTSAAAELERYERERPAPSTHDAQNILLIGSDTRKGAGNRKYGRGEGQRSDTTILLHLAADRRSAAAVSVPRDLLVDIPSCRRADGTRTRKQFAQFNWAYMFGGTACTVRTVEKLTGIRVDHHMVVDFAGFKRMVDAVDGVEVCLPDPIDDADAHVELPAGPQTLNGEEALGYVRARTSLGNGSDTQRIDRQQKFLASLAQKVQSSGVLLNPTRLYPLLDAATSSITTDPGLANLRGLYDLTRGMRSIPAGRIQFLTVPRKSYAYDPNRDELVQPDADTLFTQLRMDAPVVAPPEQDTTPSGRPTDRPAPTGAGEGTGRTGIPAKPSPSPDGATTAGAMCR